MVRPIDHHPFRGPVAYRSQTDLPTTEGGIVKRTPVSADTPGRTAGGGHPDPHLAASDIRIAYESRTAQDGAMLAVDGLDLSIHRGEVVCIVGPSGCGKTTFLNAVAGFIPLTGGTLTLGGAEISGPGPERAMVFQQPSLLPWRDVLRNVTYGLEMSGLLRGRAAKDRARELLDLVGLADFADCYPHQLSGGMQQRVNLARALAVEPELLALDEPFASVDAQTRELLQGELVRLCAKTAVTALFVTHDIVEAVFLGDRVCVFGPRPGRIIAEVAVDIPKPRRAHLRREPAFIELVDRVSEALYSAAAAEGAGA
jgi:NitT/TauT family transport system ATP-binding protein